MSEQSNLTVGAWKDVERGHDRTSTRAVGDFLLTVDASADGWKWWATWGDNDIAEGETTLTRADNDVSDAWAHSLPRAKADCEEAARRAGIAVPVALTVGAALALPEVQRGEAVAESRDHGRVQIGIVNQCVRVRCLLGGAWTEWETPDAYKSSLLALPARVAPLVSADADPATRGDL